VEVGLACEVRGVLGGPSYEEVEMAAKKKAKKKAKSKAKKKAPAKKKAAKKKK
jgi:hypothetical protein